MQPPTRLLNRNYFLLWQGQTVSRLGSQAFNVALIFWVKHATESATLLGLILMVSTLPGVVLGPLGGAIADRFSRRKIIVLSDVLNGLAILALTGLLFTMPDATNLILAGLFVVSLINSVIRSFFEPAIVAAIPDLVPKTQVNRANSLGQTTQQLTLFLGQGLGGTFYRLFGAPVLFLFDGISYLFSALSESFIQIPQEIPERAPSWRGLFRQFWEDIVEGFRYVWRRKGMRELVFVSALMNFFQVPVIVLLPFYVEEHLQSPPDWYGFILAAYGLGSMVGYVLAGALNLTARRRAHFMMLFLALEALGIAALGLAQLPWQALALAFFGGIMGGFVVVNLTTILQITTPGFIRGRVFGLLGTIAGGLTPIAMGLSGIVADLLNQNIPLIYVGSGLISGSLAGLIALNRDYRRFLAYQAPPEQPDASGHPAEGQEPGLEEPQGAREGAEASQADAPDAPDPELEEPIPPVPTGQ